MTPTVVRSIRDTKTKRATRIRFKDSRCSSAFSSSFALSYGEILALRKSTQIVSRFYGVWDGDTGNGSTTTFIAYSDAFLQTASECTRWA